MWPFIKKGRLPRKEKYPPIYSKINLSNFYVVQLYADNFDTYVKQGYSTNPTVYSIVNRLSKEAANARWEVVD